MSPWGDPVVVWSDAVVELLRWRQRRRELARQGQQLVCEAERFLASLGTGRPPEPLR